MAHEPILKQCSCGQTFDLEAWRELPLLGLMRDDLEADEDLELRVCACGSTNAVRVVDIRAPSCVQTEPHDPMDRVRARR